MGELTNEELKKRFTYHPPELNQTDKYEELRAKGLELASLIKSHCPDSRERSVSFTKLEEVIMWANASIARSVP